MSNGFKATCVGALLLVAAAGISPVRAGGPFTDSDVRGQLDRSASWGTDLETGKVAIDASLVYVHDSVNRSLVINPNLAADAIRELEVVVQKDGSWLFPDGTSLVPVLGEEAIVVGDEPDGLLEASGLPSVGIERVNLVPAAGSGIKRTRHWRKCTGCTGCLNGCNVNVLYTGDPSYKYCRFALPWNTCTEELKETCKAQIFSCINCTGSVINTVSLYDWVCADNC